MFKSTEKLHEALIQRNLYVYDRMQAINDIELDYIMRYMGDRKGSSYCLRQRQVVGELG
jgi:hypothetical protein